MCVQDYVVGKLFMFLLHWVSNYTLDRFHAKLQVLDLGKNTYLTRQDTLTAKHKAAVNSLLLSVSHAVMLLLDKDNADCLHTWNPVVL